MDSGVPISESKDSPESMDFAKDPHFVKFFTRQPGVVSAHTDRTLSPGNILVMQGTSGGVAAGGSCREIQVKSYLSKVNRSN